MTIVDPIYLKCLMWQRADLVIGISRSADPLRRLLQRIERQRDQWKRRQLIEEPQPTPAASTGKLFERVSFKRGTEGPCHSHTPWMWLSPYHRHFFVFRNFTSLLWLVEFFMRINFKKNSKALFEGVLSTLRTALEVFVISNRLIARIKLYLSSHTYEI